MNSFQSAGPTSWLQRIFPAQLPPVVVLIAWVLIITGSSGALQYLLRLSGSSAAVTGDALSCSLTTQ